MHQFNKFLICFLLFFSNTRIIAANFDFEITFESALELESQKNFLKDLEDVSNKNEFEELLANQDWIEEYTLKYRPFKKSAVLNIKNRKPIFILNDIYFVDKNLKKFKFDKTEANILRASGPIKDLADILKIINFFSIQEMNKEYFKLNSVNYSHVSGWAIQTNSSIIKIGKNIDEKKFKLLRETLNYLNDKRKIPNMIDLRYKDGAALSYGK